MSIICNRKKIIYINIKNMKYSVLIWMVVLTTLSQFLLKKWWIIAGDDFLNYFFNPYSIIWILFHWIVFILFLVAIKIFPLSVVYPFTWINYVTAWISWYYFFWEDFSVAKFIAYILILGGTLFLFLWPEN